MKAKRIICFFICAFLLAAAVASPMAVGAVTLNKDTYTLDPGSLQSTSSQYSMAWIDKLVVRDDAVSFTGARIVPTPAYPYRITYAAYLEEVQQLMLVTKVDDETVTQTYNKVLEAFYYAAAALGMTDNYEDMFGYLCEYGIRMPAEMTASDKMLVSVVYAAIKYNATYVLFNKETVIPKGTTLEGAAVCILTTLMSLNAPSEIDSVVGLGVYVMKDYIEQLGTFPLTSNPSNAEIYYWIKVAAAQEYYEIPMEPYDVLTEAQKTYVDYAYLAAILNGVYEIKLDVQKLEAAHKKNDTVAVPTLICKTMLDEKNVGYAETDSCEKLFDLSCKNGFFNIDEEFYSDITGYDLYVKEDCVKLWFTPFSLAEQLGGDNSFFSVNIGGKVSGASQTTYAELDPSKKTETVKLEVSYDDKMGTKEAVTYTFNIIKVKNQATTTDGILGDIEAAIRDVVPQDNEKASQIIDNVMSFVTSAASQAQEAASQPSVTANSGVVLSTYANSDNSADQNPTKKADGSIDFGYLNDLFGQTYSADETAATSSYLTAEKQDSSLVQRAGDAIKENPEIVVAPTGIVAVGGLAGYLLSRKRKSTQILTEDEETQDDI